MRKDNEVKMDIEAEFNWDPSFDHRGVSMEVSDGVVTLRGFVTTYPAKWAAERAVKSVAGVRALVNDIEVKPPSAHLRPDPEIARVAADALSASASVPAEHIRAIVHDGHITLEGSVAHWYQRYAAESALRGLWGIRGITNNIEIRPSVSSSDVRGQIDLAFKRHANLRAEKLAIDVFDGVVTLTGTVHSWHEREDAERVAWSAPGVTRVKNELSIAAR